MDEDVISRAKIERLLEENLELTRETNLIIRDLRRWTRIGFWTRVALWAIVIVLPLIFIGSLIRSFAPSGGSQTPGVNPFGMPSQEQLQEVIDLYRGEGG